MSDSDFIELPPFGLSGLRLPEESLEQILLLDRIYSSRDPNIDILIDINSNQVTRVADVLHAVDTAVRRATRFLDGGYPTLLQNGEIKPISAQVGGLIAISVEISSYKAQHAYHGKSREVSKRHPIVISLLTNALVSGAFYFLPSDQGSPGTQVNNNITIVAPSGSSTIYIPHAEIRIGRSQAPIPHTSVTPHFSVKHKIVTRDETVTIETPDS